MVTAGSLIELSALRRLWVRVRARRLVPGGVMMDRFGMLHGTPVRRLRHAAVAAPPAATEAVAYRFQPGYRPAAVSASDRVAVLARRERCYPLLTGDALSSYGGGYGQRSLRRASIRYDVQGLAARLLRVEID